MLQTVLLTALSAQLITHKPAKSPASPTPQVEISRVLTDKNYVNVVVEQDYHTYSLYVKKVGDVLPLPELQKTIVRNATLLQPTTKTQSLSDAITVLPTVTPTVTPTTEPTENEQPIQQVAISTTSSSNGAISDAALDVLGSCEAGNNPARNSGNGYYGAFQFSYGTWKSMNTGYERADLAPLEIQKAAVRQLLNRSSIYNQFPGCARKMHGEGII